MASIKFLSRVDFLPQTYSSSVNYFTRLKHAKTLLVMYKRTKEVTNSWLSVQQRNYQRTGLKRWVSKLALYKFVQRVA